MPSKIKLAKQRLTICKLVMLVVAECCTNYLETDMAAAASDELMLCVAVLIGQLEGRPMTASKIAAYAGMNRVTTIRKLGDLQRRGLAEKRASGVYVLPVERLNSSKLTEMVQRLIKHIQLTASQLSKLNT
jgi:hypothetical protein